MTEVIVFPDVEAVLVSALAPALGVPVATKIPSPRPARFVRVSRIGGTRRDVVTDQALVVVEAWAVEGTDASDLGRLALAHVHALAQTTHGGDYVRAVREVGGLQSFPDPTSGTPRYQFTAQIDTRGVPL